jgi:predicted Zn-dependent protease
MSEYPQLLFFDGYKASPREVHAEIGNGRIYISNIDDQDGHVLVFEISNATTSFTGNRLFIFLNNGAAPYLSIDIGHASFNDLKNSIQPERKSWFGKLSGLRWQVLLIILVGIFVITYFVIARIIPAAALKIITTKQETEIGNSFYRSLMVSEKKDTASTRIVNEFASHLQLSEKYQIKITVIKESEINAYALPGGHIVLYSGILQAIDDPAMLVALLGHEASHINKRHSMQSMLSAMSTSLLRSMILSGFGDVGSVVLEHAGMLEQLSYSRKLEREADREGMELMIRNHINPVGMKKLMLRLQEENNDLPGMFSFISTHPMSEERIKTADAFAAAHKSATFAPNPALGELWKQLKVMQ